MNIYSRFFEDRGEIPRRFTCDGDSVNPELVIIEVPLEAKSLALIVDDPDAPGGRWVHWTMWNIDPETAYIKEADMPPGAVEGETSAKNVGYHGPCPPAGTHRYYFKLYALDSMLALPPGTPFPELEHELGEHTVEYAELMGQYTRSGA